MLNEIRIALPGWIDDEIDRTRPYADDAARVGLAIRLAQRNIEERTGGPFGAVIFDSEGRIVAAGINVVLAQHCSAAHAEIVAFALAQARVQRARLNKDGRRYVLATSTQPCAMCYGASFWAGIDEILIGARSSDVTELSGFDEGPLPADWVGEFGRRGIDVCCDIRREEARAVLRRYAELGGSRY
jgi:tRNA(Arg) A34 adenosine deaminase TadA